MINFKDGALIDPYNYQVDVLQRKQFGDAFTYKDNHMIVASLVLVAVLLSIIALVGSFNRQPRGLVSDETGISNAVQLDAAIKMQRAKRIEELRRRATDGSPWPYALLGLAFSMQIAAVAVDHLAHPAIACITILPAFGTVLAARASQRRHAQNQLDKLERL